MIITYENIVGIIYIHTVFTVNTDPVFEGSTCRVCIINVTAESYFFALPHSPSSMKADFLCLAVRLPTESEECLNLMQHCESPNSTFSNTIYSSSLEVCGSPEEICFSNVTHEMNNTKLNFFISETNSCPVLPSGRAESRLYTAHYNLITKGITE